MNAREYTDRRTAAEIRRDMQLLRLYAKYTRPDHPHNQASLIPYTRFTPSTRSTRPDHPTRTRSRQHMKIAAALALLAVLLFLAI